MFVIFYQWNHTLFMVNGFINGSEWTTNTVRLGFCRKLHLVLCAFLTQQNMATSILLVNILELPLWMELFIHIFHTHIYSINTHILIQVHLAYKSFCSQLYSRLYFTSLCTVKFSSKNIYESWIREHPLFVPVHFQPLCRDTSKYFASWNVAVQ